MSIACYDSDGKALTSIYQWDIDRIVRFEGVNGTDLSGITDVHITNKGHRNALRIASTTDRNSVTVTIPNIIARDVHPVVVYLYQQMPGTEERTVYEVEIPIIQRAMPVAYADMEVTSNAQRIFDGISVDDYLFAQRGNTKGRVTVRTILDLVARTDVKGIYNCTYGTTTYANIAAARQSGKLPVVEYDNGIYALTYLDSSKARFSQADGIPNARVFVLTCTVTSSNVWSNGEIELATSAEVIAAVRGKVDVTDYNNDKALIGAAIDRVTTFDVYYNSTTWAEYAEAAVLYDKPICRDGETYASLWMRSEHSVTFSTPPDRHGEVSIYELNNTTGWSKVEYVFRPAADQDDIDALQDAAIAAKYTKPAGGIPASDLANGVIPSVPTASNATPQVLGTAAAGSSDAYSRADHVHAKPTYTASDVGAAPAITEVTVTTSGAVAQALDAGKMYHFTGALSSLTVTLTAAASGQMAQYHFDFTEGSTAFDPVFPNTVTLPDGHTWAADTHYEVDILNGYAVVASWAVSA